MQLNNLTKTFHHNFESNIYRVKFHFQILNTMYNFEYDVHCITYFNVYHFSFKLAV